MTMPRDIYYENRNNFHAFHKNTISIDFALCVAIEFVTSQTNSAQIINCVC